ncbi:MAG: hypothetical protein AABX17_02760, partial [Nanoarchaeota archaeon]
MLDFCPMCKGILVPGEWKGKPVGRCSCGFIRTSGIVVECEDKNENKEEIRGSGISQDKIIEGVDFSCKKCGFDRAEAQSLGEILGNEKSVTLFTCLKCGN